jgi:hypothetical protein
MAVLKRNRRFFPIWQHLKNRDSQMYSRRGVNKSILFHEYYL